MKEIARNIWADIINAISNQDTFVGKIFGKVEEKSGRTRYQTARLLSFVIWAFLIFSTSAEVLCNLICFCYPAVKTIMEIEERSKRSTALSRAATPRTDVAFSFMAVLYTTFLVKVQPSCSHLAHAERA
ncbi:hypothetical protein T10_6272 [Trichinella papuae]|uniref:Uncharacterized protein n=1 Tax=Trichinella papuae TaxID=268474 RepID=A0A0V1MHM5_9BILA|nr:hypothetical protein T10_6272 [Trichinella papuae]